MNWNVLFILVKFVRLTFWKNYIKVIYYILIILFLPLPRKVKQKSCESVCYLDKNWASCSYQIENMSTPIFCKSSFYLSLLFTILSWHDISAFKSTSMPWENCRTVVQSAAYQFNVWLDICFYQLRIQYLWE
jgi:hypothetical protein